MRSLGNTILPFFFPLTFLSLRNIPINSELNIRRTPEIYFSLRAPYSYRRIFSRVDIVARRELISRFSIESNFSNIFRRWKITFLRFDVFTRRG